MSLLAKRSYARWGQIVYIRPPPHVVLPRFREPSGFFSTMYSASQESAMT